MRPALTALLILSVLVGAAAARSAAENRGAAAPAMPHALASRLTRPSNLPIGGIVTGRLAVAGCPAGVETVILPAFNSSVDPDVGLAGREGVRFLTFYAGFKLPEGGHRVAMTAIHLMRASGESFGVWARSFETENLVRFAVPRDCPPATDAELGRVMASGDAG